MKKMRVVALWMFFWLLYPRYAGAEEFLYLPITRIPVITVGFCGYRNPSGSCHGGIDYDVRDDGDEIVAAADGVVEVAENGWSNTLRRKRVYGNYIQVLHDNGYRTLYGHLKNGTLEVGVGDEVRAGELLGIGDNSGWSTGSHLHFEVRDAAGRKVDPYGESPGYPNCGANRLWVNCPPTFWVEEDRDGDTWTVEGDDCDDRNPDVHPDATELCNTFDDNCDGETDELWPLLGRTCTVRISPFCERDGVWVCEPLHRGTVCDADYTIYPETCDGTDDDCDGETDEDWLLLGSACDVGFGECRRSGVWVCEPLHRGTVCDAEHVFGTPELCDSLDNDCDTETDEDWPELGLICGVFPCDGIHACSLGGSGSYCNVSPGMPETCDGLDNDCDGETDESPAEFSCDDGNDCTADSCLLGACRRLSRDRDGDTYADELCGGSDCNDRDSTTWTYSFATSRLTTSAGDSGVPVLVWTGTELAVAWEDWRAGLPNAEVYFARSNTSLARIGDEIRVTDAPYGSREPSLIWNGSEYGLSWYDNRRDSSRTELYFTRLDAGGLEIGGDIRLTDHSVASGATYSTSLAWTGSGFGIAFQDSRLSPMDIFFLRLRPDGTALGVEAPIVSDSGSENFPILVWAGTGYGLAYTVSAFGYQQILFVRADSSGSRIGDVTTVAAFDTGRSYAEAVDLAWQGSEFVVIWTKNMASGAREIYFRKLDATGTPLTPEVMITSSTDIIYKIAITHSGGEYGVTWQESPSFPARAYFVRLDESGTILSPEVELTTTQRTGEKVSVVWTGHEYLFAWSDNRDGDWEIYLGRIGCGW